MSSRREPSVVTLLFTDVVGSTQLTDLLGDEAAQEIMRVHNALVRAEVARHGGSEVKTMGDGFMIAFDSVTAALACAVGIQKDIVDHNREHPSREFMVRMGLNAGEAIREEADFFGAAVIVAARVAALAEGGEILTTEAVKQLGQGARGMEYTFKGEFQLKGLREPYRVYQVVSGAIGRPAVAALRRPRFVGRRQELEELKEYLEQVAAGAGLFVLLAGEPGAGKTRLAEEFARHARSRGFRVFGGRCYETEGAPPYMPIVEILRAYVQGRPPDVLLDDLGDDAPTIAKLVPELASLLPIAPEGVPLPAEQERYRLLEAVRRWLEQIGRRPTLLLIEDVHWAGPATCLLLRHIASTLTIAPVFILATYREDDHAASDSLSAALAEYGRLQIYRRMTLKGLAADDIAELLAAISDQAPPPGLTTVLHRQTEGNPFFVTELINHLEAEGSLLAPSGDWRSDLLQGGWDIPESVRVVIGRRLDALNDETRRLLTIGSVLGRDFTYDLLEALGEVAADALLDSLDEAIRMGMLEEAADAAARFRFAHELTRQTLYDGLTGLRRQQLHLRAGQALEQVGRAEPAQLAYHFTSAGRLAPRDKTRRHLTLAGEEASRTAAWEGAAAYYGQALALTVEGDQRERAGLLQRLGEAQSGSGEWEGAVASWRQAMDLFVQLGEKEAAGWIGFSLRKLYGARGQFAEASQTVERTLDILGEGDSEIRSRLLAQAGFIRSAFGEAEEAERLLRQSADMAERLDNAAARGFASFISGMHCLSYCRLAEAAERLSEAARWSLTGADPWTASQASSFRRHILFTLGKLSEAEEAMEEEERLARRAGNFLAVCETKWISSCLACLRGDLQKGEELARQLVAAIREMQANSGLPGALMNLAYIRFLRGDWEAFEELLSEAVGSHDRLQAAPIDDPRPVLLLLRALAGQEEAARSMLPEVRRYFNFEDPWTTSLAEARATLAAALAVLDQKGAAQELYQPLKDWTGVSGYVLTGASSIPQLVSRVLAMTAAASGRGEEADLLFEEAIREARRLGALTELAEAGYWYARTLLERGGAGDRERAQELLGESSQVWQQAGMPRHLERAQRLAASAPWS